MGRGRSWPGQVGYTYTHGHSWFQRRKQIILEERERESNSIQNLGVRFGELYVLLEESAKWLTKKWLNLLIGSTFCHSHSVVVHSNNLSVYGSICLLVWFLLDKTVKPKRNISVISKPITSFSKLTWLNLERGERHTLRDASALWQHTLRARARFLLTPQRNACSSYNFETLGTNSWMLVVSSVSLRCWLSILAGCWKETYHLLQEWDLK